MMSPWWLKYLKILIDEKISPKTAKFLDNKGPDVETVRNLKLGAKDKEIVELAIKQNRTIITQDEDFRYISSQMKKKQKKHS